MYMKMPRVLSWCGFFMLTACVTPNPYLYVGQGGLNGKPALVPQGYGWQPGSKVQMWLYSEPKSEDGEVFASPTPRMLGTITVDAYGMFGFDDNPANKFPIERNICGAPPEWAKPWFVARDVQNNTVKFPEPFSPNPAHLWFTYQQPCR